ERGSHVRRINNLVEDDLESRMFLAEELQGGGHDLGRGCLGHADTHPDALAAFSFLGVGGHRLDLTESAPRTPADSLPGRSQPHLSATAWPAEQRPAERRFERGDLMRQRGRGVSEFGGGPPKGSQLRNGNDGPEFTQAETGFNRAYRS